MPVSQPRLLVVDDDRAILTMIGRVGLSQGFDVATTVDGQTAMIQLRRRPADLALVDLRMPGVSGLDVLRSIRDVNPRCRIVLMSGYATIDTAVEAVKLGAADFLTKPFALQRLRALLSSVHEDAALRGDMPAAGGDVVEWPEFCGMVGRSATMQALFALIRRLAPHARTTLISGETGTGKELAARALHALGPREDRRLVTVNCSAIVESLFESELFGHVRGAFTGATEAQEGLFESADGGTLMLDEVGELPLSAQAKLLRVLENGEVQRVGAVERRKVDVRLIAVTNRDLAADVAAGRFRGDLFYRLNVAEITVPPLRDRRDDIPYLTAAFVRQFARRFDRTLTGVTAAADRMLRQASWSGNVRQLRNVIERACMLADGECIDLRDLTGLTEDVDDPAPERSGRRCGPAPLAEIEREHIVRTLEQVSGNKAVAARLLGVSRRALYRHLERHGLHTRMPAGREWSTPTRHVERVS